MNTMRVNAGKYEHDGSKNYKYCSEPYQNWNDLINRIFELELQLYPFCEIDFYIGGFIHTVSFYDFQRPQNFKEQS